MKELQMIMSYPLMPELGISDLQAVLIHRRTEGSKSLGQSLSLPIFAPAPSNSELQPIQVASTRRWKGLVASGNLHQADFVEIVFHEEKSCH
jgi:hypothetical protein